MDKAGKDTTIIGAKTTLNGELHHDGAVEVHGLVDGAIKATGDVRVAEGAGCRGTIEAARAALHGDVEGDVIASERLELGSNARFVGDLVTSTLIVEEGASFVGQCRVSSTAAADKNGLAQAASADHLPRVEVAQVQLDDAERTNGARAQRRTVKTAD